METLTVVFGQVWVGVLVGILAGFLITFFFYRASRIGPRPTYRLQVLRLITKAERALPQEVEILFQGSSVPRLTKTNVIFWNSGRAMLDGKQIVDTDPLRVEFGKNAQVLRARIAKATHKTNQFEVRINDKSPNEVVCHFDYLDVGDGVVIELLHTDEEFYPIVRGTIRGVPKGILNWGNINTFMVPSYLDLGGFRKVMLFIVLAFGVITTALGFLSALISRPSESSDLVMKWVLIGVGLILVVVSLFMLWNTRKGYPKSLMTEDIEQ